MSYNKEAVKRFHETHPGYATAYAREYRRRNPDKVAKYYATKREKVKQDAVRLKNKELTQKYNITLNEWTELLEKQGSRCAICNTENLTGKWHTDHHHGSGRVRGILCSRCNLALGLLKDNPTVLRAAADYVEKYDE